MKPLAIFRQSFSHLFIGYNLSFHLLSVKIILKAMGKINGQ